MGWFVGKTLSVTKTRGEGVAGSGVMGCVVGRRTASGIRLSGSLGLDVPAMLSGIGRLLTGKVTIRAKRCRSANKQGTGQVDVGPTCHCTIKVEVATGRTKFMLIGLDCRVRGCREVHLRFSARTTCCLRLDRTLREFLSSMRRERQVLKVKVSVPKVIGSGRQVLVGSRTLRLRGCDLDFLRRIFSLPICFRGSTGTTVVTRSLGGCEGTLCLSLGGALKKTFYVSKGLVPKTGRGTKRFKRVVLIPNKGGYCYKGRNYTSTCYTTDILASRAGRALRRFVGGIRRRSKRTIGI